MIEEPAQHRFKRGQPIPESNGEPGSCATGEPIIAVAVKSTEGRINYFLTLGKPFYRKQLWEIAKSVLERCDAFSLDGTADEAEVCYSLHDAASEPYFHEQHQQLIITLANVHSEADKQQVADEIESGQHLYFLGSAKRRAKARASYWSMK